MDDYLNARIGEEYKQKLQEIAEKQERSMTGELRAMIKQRYDQVIDQ
jgi:predicted transcriptional regulator